jgi:hypothetical protein
LPTQLSFVSAADALADAAEERPAKARLIEDTLQVRVHPFHMHKWLDFLSCGLARVEEAGGRGH